MAIQFGIKIMTYYDIQFFKIRRQRVSNRLRLLIIRPCHILVIKIQNLQFFFRSKTLHKITKTLITKVHRAQQTVSQELIQTHRERRNLCFDSLMVYLIIRSFLSVLKDGSYPRDTEH